MTSIEEKIHTLPLVSIKIRDRMRKDIGDLSGLMDSIKRHGLIHPIVNLRQYVVFIETKHQ